MQSVIDKAKALTEARNRMIHNLWARNTAGAEVVRDDNLGTVGPIPTLRELTDLADELGKLAKKLNGARHRGYNKASNAASF